jgi:hypothetical protein
MIKHGTEKKIHRSVNTQMNKEISGGEGKSFVCRRMPSTPGKCGKSAKVIIFLQPSL